MLMRAKATVALIFLLVAVVAVPSLSARTNAMNPTGLLGAYYKGSFFGSPLPAGTSYPTDCVTETETVPATPSVSPTVVAVDSNINTGSTTGWFWVENGFTEGGVTFHTVQFSVEWTGYITPPVTGTYTFTLESDDGSWLYIGGTQVVNNGGFHAHTPVSGTISLTGGDKYQIEVDYYETCDDQSGIDLSWTVPGSSSAIVPTSVLSPAAIGSNTGLSTPEFPVGFLAVLAIVFPGLLVLRAKHSRLLSK
jgi:hypothetical protein